MAGGQGPCDQGQTAEGNRKGVQGAGGAMGGLADVVEDVRRIGRGREAFGDQAQHVVGEAFGGRNARFDQVSGRHVQRPQRTGEVIEFGLPVVHGGHDDAGQGTCGLSLGSGCRQRSVNLCLCRRVAERIRILVHFADTP